VYEGPGRRTWTEVPDPTITGPQDAIIQVDTATICGTDLHILGGDVPEAEPGRILGHEAVGTVVDVGDAVTELRPGDRVLASCISACGRCHYCRRARYGQCLGGGWILGHRVDGVQAQYARLPFAGLSTHKLTPKIGDETAVMLADIAIRPGDDPLEVVRPVTGGLGADVAFEAVGVPETFELCTTLIRPCGHVANIGVHGRPATLHPEDLWIRDVTITAGLVDTFSTPDLLAMLGGGQLDIGPMVTHRFALEDIEQAYEVFADPAHSGALKVTLSRT
jgi:alcohol dehydrogenase